MVERRANTGITNMESSDGELLDRYRRGDTQALEDLVQRYRRQLFGFIVNMAGQNIDADEIFQEVWIKAIRRIDSYRDRNFLAWLMSIARNLIIDKWRASRRMVSIDDGNEGPSRANNIAAPGPGPDGCMVNADLRRDVAAAIDALPREQKEVVLMRLEAELPFKQIARIQGVSINTALARMQYGLQKLRELLKSDYGTRIACE
jgi:RNA polymerase sigma-70 factor (ECF subfamily)